MRQYKTWRDEYQQDHGVLKQLSVNELTGRSRQMAVCASQVPDALSTDHQAYLMLSGIYSEAMFIRMHSYLQRHGLIVSFLKEDESPANR